MTTNRTSRAAAKPASKAAPRKRTTTPKPDPQPEPVEEIQHYALPEDHTQRQAYFDTYFTLKQAGLDIPEHIRIPVDEAIASEIQRQEDEKNSAIYSQERIEQERIADLNMTGPTYVRNLTNNPFHFRLDRQGDGTVRVQLKPRGLPGDIHPLKDEDLQDSVLVTNLNIGLIELIPAGEADIIMRKQTNNMGTRIHPALQILNKEQDQLSKNGIQTNGEASVKVEAEFNSRGVTVSTIDPRVNQGGLETRAIKKNEGIGGSGLTRVGQETQSTFVPTGGNPVSISYDPGDLQTLMAKDAIARSKNIEGPAAGLGQISVKIEPTQRVN